MVKFILSLMVIIFIAKSSFASNNLENDLDSVNRMLEKQINEEQQAKRKALFVAEEVYSTRKSLISAAKKIQEAEEQVSGLEVKFKSLKVDEQKIISEIKIKKAHIAKLLAILQAMSLRPVEALVIQESDPVNALRSSLLLRDTIPLITRETDELKTKLSELTNIREKIRKRYLEIKQATGELKSERQQISVLLKKKIGMQKNYETKAKKSGAQAKKLAAKAKDLQDLILELERQKVEQVFTFDIGDFDFAGMKGKMPLPVKGKIIKKYGESLQSGIISKGISLSARKSAQVTAPFDGTVVFSGPFRDYRDMLIIDHGDGYHTLLAGMARNDTIVGQGLLAGEPVGVLPENDPTLYVEIRKKGKAVNPIGWFTKK